MKRFRKHLLVLLLLVNFLNPAAVRAFEPASLIAAAPQAAALAAQWSPHAISALGSFGLGLVEAGNAFIDIFRLPLGVVECSAGIPFGFWDDGLSNIGTGCIAPFRFVGQILLLPVRLISLGVVR